MTGRNYMKHRRNSHYAAPDISIVLAGLSNPEIAELIDVCREHGRKWKQWQTITSWGWNEHRLPSYRLKPGFIGVGKPKYPTIYRQR
jgi:hypothetical protein